MIVSSNVLKLSLIEEFAYHDDREWPAMASITNNMAFYIIVFFPASPISLLHYLCSSHCSDYISAVTVYSLRLTSNIRQIAASVSQTAIVMTFAIIKRNYT